MDALGPDAVLALLASGAAPESVGPFAERPWLLVDLDRPAGSGAIWPLLTTLPCVVIGVGHPSTAASTPDAVDVALTPDADPPSPWVSADESEIAALLGNIDASPMASVAHAQLLRLGQHLSLVDAVVAESLAYGLLQTSDQHRAWLASGTRPQHHATVRPPVRVERDGSTVTLTLDRAEARNAYDVATRDALVDALRAAVHDPSVHAVELEGDGADFCAGGDLSEFGTVPTPALGHLVRTTRSAGITVATATTRATAHLHGACIGAGIELPAFFDHVVADTTTTSIRLPEVAFGLIPGAGGTASIPKRIGRQRTAWLALTGEAIDAATAHRWGLVDELV